MPRKKINFNAKIKLSEIDLTEKIDEQNDLKILNRKGLSKIISFRLRDIDFERINKVLNDINNVNHSHPFNKTDLIRGMIMLALETNTKKVLDYIRKSI